MSGSEQRRNVRTAVVWDDLREVLEGTGGALDVLDIGGGTGVSAVRVAGLGHRVTVVDPSPDALASLGRRAREEGVEVLAHQGDLSTPLHWWRIVGVVADVKNGAAGEPAQPEVFGTFNQFDTVSQASLYLAVRTVGDPAAFPADLRMIVSSASAQAAVDQVMTMEARLERTLTRPRLAAALLVGFAAFALLVAGI